MFQCRGLGEPGIPAGHGNMGTEPMGMCAVKRCKSENAGDLSSLNLKENCHSKELPWLKETEI